MIITGLLFLLVFIFFICIKNHVLHHSFNLRKVIYGSLGIGLGICIIIPFLNKPWLVIPEQTEIIQKMAELYGHKQNELKDSVVIKNNFVFIDDAYSNQIVPSEKSSTERITNRGELAQIMSILESHPESYDLLVCDIFFDLKSKDDDLLYQKMRNLVRQHKLILAENFNNPNTPPFNSFPKEIYGNVVDSATNNEFSVYRPFYHGSPSLADLIYHGYKNGGSTQPVFFGLFTKETGSDGGLSIGLNPYLPSFSINDENVLYQKDDPLVGDETVTDKNYYSMGEILAHPAADFTQELAQRRSEGKRNIIFLGHLTGDLDKHQTFYGEMHGSSIQLNLFLSHLNGQNLIRLPALLFLWVGFSLLVFVLYCKALEAGPFVMKKKKGRKKNWTKAAFVQALKAAFVILFIEEIHYWLFGLVILCYYYIFSKIINAMVLFIIIGLLYKTLKYTHEKTVQR